MVTTTDGVRVDAGDKGEGMPEAQATSSAADRNARAETLGIRARYVIAPFEAPAK